MASDAVVARLQQEVDVLKQRNEKLRELHTANKRQISTLEDTLVARDKEQKEYVQTLQCVDRLWRQLDGDVARLAAEAAGEPLPSPLAEAAAAAAGSAAATAEPPPGWDGLDPFLRRLLADPACHKAVKRYVLDHAANLSEVEQALHARSAGTLEALGAMADTLRTARAAAAARVEHLAAAAPDEAARAAAAEVAAEVAALRAQVDGMVAQQRSAAALVRQYSDRTTEAEEALRSTRNDLADKEMLLSQAYQKAESLKQQLAAAAAVGGGAGAGGSQGGAAPGAAGASSGGGGGGSGAHGFAGDAAPASAADAAAAQQQQGEAAQELQAQLQDMQALLEQSRAAADEEARRHSVTQR